MKFLNENKGLLDADSGDDAVTSTQLLRQRAEALRQQIAQLPPGFHPTQKAELLLELGPNLVDLKESEDAFSIGREAFDIFVDAEDWENAVVACDIMYQADDTHSLAALGQGVWLAVTFPINPELTVSMLNHIVDETPPESDGAAVAATVAHYIADIRAQGKDKENLMLFTNNLLASVARRHGNVESQEQFDYWFNKLELNDPALFLPRLRNVIDVMVQEQWWIDRDSIHAKLPDN
jgi:hypothetical protein